MGLHEAREWERAAVQALIGHYGQWACGWTWGRGDAGGAGPVTAWCSVTGSISTPEETLVTVARALVEWREWLEDLAARFDRLLPLPSPRGADGLDEVIIAWEAAVAHLVNASVGRTGGEGGWHSTCRLVLTWFLEAAHVPARWHEALIDDAIGGRFQSWVDPSAADVVDVAERLAVKVVGRSMTRSPVYQGHAADEWPDTWPESWPSWRATNLAGVRRTGFGWEKRWRDDHLEAWQRVREQVDWASASAHVHGPVIGERDAIAEYAAGRSVHFRSAVGQAYEAATEGGPLTFDRLAQWQRTVLGGAEAAWRTTTAWAKDGRERYGWHHDLPARFERCLAEATDMSIPLPSRAARVYLDVAFFHPFPDGNARAASLALYYVLAREQVLLDHAEPLLVTVRRADDLPGAAGFAGAIAALIEGTGSSARPT